MKIVKPSFEILGDVNGVEMLRAIEVAGRTCYKSEDRVTIDSAEKFVRNIIARGHESVLEHQSVSVRIVCDRGVSHELVRHRLASYSQESTRYCNYSKDGQVTFIEPCFYEKGSHLYNLWCEAMENAESVYLFSIECSASPQEARSVLPNSVKTEVVATMNLRQWRHFFKIRAAGEAGMPHPQMLEITIPMLEKFKELIPVVFDDIMETK